MELVSKMILVLIDNIMNSDDVFQFLMLVTSMMLLLDTALLVNWMTAQSQMEYVKQTLWSVTIDNILMTDNVKMCLTFVMTSITQLELAPHVLKIMNFKMMVLVNLSSLTVRKTNINKIRTVKQSQKNAHSLIKLLEDVWDVLLDGGPLTWEFVNKSNALREKFHLNMVSSVLKYLINVMIMTTKLAIA